MAESDADFQGDANQDLLNPLLTSVNDKGPDYEEGLAPVDHVLSQTEIILLSVRCAIIAFYLLSIVIVIIDIARDKLRLKCWRLYIFVSIVLFCWLGLSLFQDHIDAYFVHVINDIPQRNSIYWCFRNLVHGLTLYLIILLLCHLSDFQHRGWWLLIIFAVILVPLAYSVGLLVIDLRLHPDSRTSMEWNVGIDTVRIFLYNILTSILLFVFSRRFCTKVIFGSLSEHRSPIVVLISRWTFSFLLLHNLTAIGSYAAAVTSRVPPADGFLINIEKAVTVHQALEEAQLLMIVLSVPFSYVIGLIAQCCFGGIDEADQEMSKVDKIYDEVWTTQSGRRVTTARNPPGSRPPSEPVSTNPGAARGRTGANSASNGRQNGAQRSRHGSTTSSTESLGAADFILAKPSGSTTSINAMSSSNLTAAEMAAKKKNRESYMEAISMGSMQDIDGRHSRTSEPIDL